MANQTYWSSICQQLGGETVYHISDWHHIHSNQCYNETNYNRKYACQWYWPNNSVSGKQTTKEYFSTKNWSHVVLYQFTAWLFCPCAQIGSSHKTHHSTAYIFKIGTVPRAEKLHGMAKLNSLTINVMVSYFLLVKTRRDVISVGIVNS